MSEVRDLPADAAWFRDRVAALGHSQSSLAREMAELGDPRPVKQILRGISRIATGTTNLPGEMRVILNLLAARQGKG